MSAIDDEPKGEPEVELAGASELRLICAEYVLGLFPDICPDYLSRVSTERGHDYEAVVTHILDQSEDGQSYPKRQRVNLKRKRGDEIHEGEDDPAVAAALRFDSDDQRSKLKETEYIKMSKQLLQQAFPLLLVRNLYAEFADQGNCLFPTIRALDKKLQDPQAAGPPLEFKKKGVKLLPEYEAEHLDNTIRNTEDEWAKQALEEFKLARLVGDTYQDKKDEERQRAEAEAENLRLAVLEGTAQDCQCCFAECALNRMVHCDGETFHWFCRDCARRTAEAQVGLSKYELVCMHTDKCSAGFDRDQRSLFLDAKMQTALERIEQEAMLRLAGIENLETCPFCPYAAEYPPVEVDKEFRCQNPECDEISCRLCRKPTHIPKSCAEAEMENGHSARRAIEEAMSSAMIRKCNKCGTPFIKENGCNKMTCTRNGCYNVQCYVCHKTCEYSHFNDTNRGGKAGNCPLFDSSEQRHENEVTAAEKAARDRVAEENPQVDAALLEIRVSSKVKEDEKRRKMEDVNRNGLPGAVPGAAQVPGAGPVLGIRRDAGRRPANVQVPYNRNRPYYNAIPNIPFGGPLPDYALGGPDGRYVPGAVQGPLAGVGGEPGILAPPNPPAVGFQAVPEAPDAGLPNHAFVERRNRILARINLREQERRHQIRGVENQPPQAQAHAYAYAYPLVGPEAAGHAGHFVAEGNRMLPNQGLGMAGLLLPEVPQPSVLPAAMPAGLVKFREGLLRHAQEVLHRRAGEAEPPQPNHLQQRDEAQTAQRLHPFACAGLDRNRQQGVDLSNDDYPEGSRPPLGSVPPTQNAAIPVPFDDMPRVPPAPRKAPPGRLGKLPPGRLRISQLAPALDALPAPRVPQAAAASTKLVNRSRSLSTLAARRRSAAPSPPAAPSRPRLASPAGNLAHRPRDLDQLRPVGFVPLAVVARRDARVDAPQAFRPYADPGITWAPARSAAGVHRPQS